MSTGTRLKKARKSLGLSIEDIQDKSKIKKNYIKAMENDNFDKLPGEVYTKVYIRGYAKIVGLDPQEILAEYANENGKNSNKEIKREEKKVKKKKKKDNLTKSDKIFRSIIGIILILILILLSYNMFFRSDQKQNGTAINNQNNEVVEQESTDNNVDNNNEEQNNQTEIEEIESVNSVVNDSEKESVTEEESIETESEEENNTEAKPIIKDTTIQFKIIATDKSWLQVKIDDDLKFQGFIDEDEVMTHNGEETVTLKIGNGIAVQVEINGEVLGPFGKRGEVIIKQFDLN
jgi:cytoskeletal protein RodZ